MSAAVEIDWTTFTITEPSLVHGMPNETYHADPVVGGSLSHSGSKLLLPPNTPAVFDWYRHNPQPTKKAWDVGNGVHDTLLGGGPEIVVCDYPDWRTRKAQDEAKEIRARGAVPILSKDKVEIDAMVAAVRAHPLGRRLFDPDHGQPEVSLFWTDQRSGVNRRARVDFLPDQGKGRYIVPDLKTCESADTEKFSKSAMDYRYHSQGPFYLDGVVAHEIAEDPAFVFVAVEKRPPYLVNTIQLDVEYDQIGRLLNRRAIDTYAACSASGEWPGYPTEVQLASPPAWYARQFEDDLIYEQRNAS